MKKIYKALFEVQKSVGVIYKTQTGQVGKGSYKYADIGTVLETLAPHFQRNNVLLSQAVVDLNNTMIVTKQTKIENNLAPSSSSTQIVIPQMGIHTVLRYVGDDAEEDDFIESITPIPSETESRMSVYQSYGSGITYFRRYSLASLLGLVTDEDNDGNTQKSQAIHQKSKITESVMKRIETRAKGGNITYDELIAAVKENFEVTKENEEQIKSFF